MIPGSANALLLATAAGAAGGFTIERSLRFNSADSAYLSRTPASSGNLTTWTLGFWVKRGSLSNGTEQEIFNAGSSSVNYFGFRFSASDQLTIFDRPSSGNVGQITTNAVYRDCSAWYHIVYVWDTNNSTQADRRRLYVNGVRITSFATDQAITTSGTQSRWNQNIAHAIGRFNPGASIYFDGYLADVNFVDGSALDPTSFGEFDATTGVWNPIAYTGSYGTNGFHLDFADNSSAAALGYDAAGSNDWTVNNLSVTAGAGNDSLRDSPTNGDTANDTGLGGEVPGNYCTWNSLIITTNNTLSQGNLRAVHAASSWSGNIRGSNSSMFVGTFGVSSGKWYWEITMNDAGNTITGVVSSAMGHQYYVGHTNNLSAGFVTASLYQDSSWGTYQSMPTLANGDIVGVALDMDNGKLWFSKNGTFVNSGNPVAGTGSYTTGITGTLYPALSNIGSTGPADGEANFGQRAFSSAAPSGFKALCTANLPTPTIEDPSTVMDVKLWTGDGSATRSLTGIGFNPDLVWLKSRSVNNDHNLFDSVRGVEKTLSSNLTAAEVNQPIHGYVTAFNSDGFSVAGGSLGDVNYASRTYVAWCWDAGSSTATNNSGTISSQVRANISAGFSVVTYTGNGTAGATIGHGLGVAPEFLIIKPRSITGDWIVYSKPLGNGASLFLDLTLASTTSTNFNNTTPNSTVFTVSSSSEVNGNGSTYVAYCFAPVAGYSAFGSYTGNGSTDGPFVYTGFRPRWVLIKMSSSTGAWYLIDTARIGYNPDNNPLYPNLTAAEPTDDIADILSNGFKIRNSFAGVNTSSGTYIWAAFAESPFAYSRAR